MMTRRRLLRTMAAASAVSAGARPLRVVAQAQSITLERAGMAPVPVPANFIGLGYEMSSVATLGLLSSANACYVRLLQNLAPAGVLRVGGIVADYTRYEANGAPRADKQDTVITHESLQQFGGFLQTIGWTAIWSLNFAQGTLAEAVEEAKAVAAVLGSRLLAFELGNEVDAYGRGQHIFRPAPYSYETYRAEFSGWRAAILAAVPHVSFAAPDTTTHAVDWTVRMAGDAHGEVQLLTTHYYRDGQQHGTAEELLTPDPKLEDELNRLRAASTESGIPWRMCETNSFFGGGRPGVSNTFTGALWTLDYMSLLASSGCAGVNMETGVNQLGFVSSYSPVQDDGHGVNSAGVPYYGMLAFATAFRGCNQALRLRPVAADARITAYAFGREGRPQTAVLVNRGVDDAQISLTELGMKTCTVLRLRAPSPESTTGSTFGGAAVRDDGRWSAATSESVHDGSVRVPPMSAAVIRL